MCRLIRIEVIQADTICLALSNGEILHDQYLTGRILDVHIKVCAGDRRFHSEISPNSKQFGIRPRHDPSVKINSGRADDKSHHHERQHEPIERHPRRTRCDDLRILRHFPRSEQTSQQHRDRQNQCDHLRHEVDVILNDNHHRHRTIQEFIELLHQIYRNKDHDKPDDRHDNADDELTNDISVEKKQGG